MEIFAFPDCEFSVLRRHLYDCRVDLAADPAQLEGGIMNIKQYRVFL